jgi:hypothetical protein
VIGAVVTLSALALPGMRDIEGDPEGDQEPGDSSVFAGAPELTASPFLR